MHYSEFLFYSLHVVKWNFEVSLINNYSHKINHELINQKKKFLIDKEGQVYKRYSSKTEPSEIAKDIEDLLKK